MNKFRCLLVQSDSQAPAPHLLVQLSTQYISLDQKDETIEEVLHEVEGELLQSDTHGYLSFVIPEAPVEGAVLQKIKLLFAGSPSLEHTIDAKTISKDPPIRAHVVRLKKEILQYKSKPGSRPFVMVPDVSDWVLSPKSFGTQGMQIVQQDGCESFLLSNAATYRYGYFQILPVVGEQDRALDLFPGGPCSPKIEMVPNTCYRHALIAEYEVSWNPMGHGLGEILYSLPLAPCESVNLAFIDWSRKDEVKRDESTNITEGILHEQRRDRMIEEITKGAISEWQRGASFMASLGIAASPVTASLGGGYFTTAGDRNVLVETMQQIVDRLAQNTSASKDLHSTIVVQSHQSESERLQTRTITNHNHCHALTILYYEIVRHFKVSTHISQIKDAILIRHPEQAWSIQRILKSRVLLKPNLLEPGLSQMMDALINPVELPLPQIKPTYGPINSMIVKTTTGDSALGFTEDFDHVNYFLLLKDGSFKRFPTKSGQALSGPNLYKPRTTVTIKFTFPEPLHLNDVVEIGLGFSYKDNDINWVLAGLDVIACTSIDSNGIQDPHLLTIFSDKNINYRFDDVGEWWGTIHRPGLTESPLAAQSESGASRLLRHFTENSHYYNRLMWLLEDSNQRYKWLSKYQYEYQGSGDVPIIGRLTDFVENRVLDVLGEYIVLPLAGNYYSSRHISRAPKALDQILSIPTRGAFAEAKLSHCNTCETIDDTRFWNWQEAPCNCHAPEITGISPGSRGRDNGALNPTQPSSSIGIEGSPNAPDPSGMQKMLELLGKSDVFKDMSGRPELAEVMKTALNGAVQMELEKMRLANAQVQREQNNANNAQNTNNRMNSGSAATSTPSPASPLNESRQRDQSYRQAQNAVQRALDGEVIHPSEAQAMQRSLLESQIKETIQATNKGSGDSPEPPSNSRIWIIDNFTIDEDDLPAVTTQNVVVHTILEEVVNYWWRHPIDSINIIGHTDRSGERTLPPNHNMELSVKRSEKVNQAILNLYRAMIQADPVRSRIAGTNSLAFLAGVTGGYGPDIPRNFPDDDNRGHNRYNRRVEISFAPTVITAFPCNALRLSQRIPLIPQPNKQTGWAAGVAMMLTYVRRHSVDPGTVYREITGLDINATAASMPWDRILETLVTRYGFSSIPQLDLTGGILSPTQWCDWLRGHGPLLFIQNAQGTRASIIHRISRTSSGEFSVDLFDAWNRNTQFDAHPVIFTPNNTGWSGSKNFNDFLAELALAAQAVGENRIYYIPT